MSLHFARNSSFFLRSPQTLQAKLDMLLAYSVEEESILKSPETFKLSVKSLENRLNELKSKEVAKIWSWMLICHSSQLSK